MSIQSVSGTTPAFAPPSSEVKTAGQPGNATAAARNKDAETVQAKPAETTKNTEKSSAKELREAVDRIAKFVSPSSSEISFSIDSESGNDVVKVIDSSSKEVIRQIPSEEVVALSRALDKLQGLFVREKI